MACSNSRQPSRRPRLEDVAADVGVSTASVSLVLRGVAGPSAETRERVLEAAARLGYRADRAASLLARRRTHLLGVPVVLRDAFRAELAEEVQVAADGRGYTVALGGITAAHDECRVVETLLDLRCEALLLLSPELAAGCARGAGGAGTGGGDRPAPGVGGVRRGAGGRRRGGRARPSTTSSGSATARSCTSTAPTPRWPPTAGAGSSLPPAARAGGPGAARRIRRGGRRSGGAAAPRRAPRPCRLPWSPRTIAGAIGLLDVFLRAGVRVPEDVSVVGYDDSALARLAHIDLTTVSQEAGEQARGRWARPWTGWTDTAPPRSSWSCPRDSSYGARPRHLAGSWPGRRPVANRRVRCAWCGIAAAPTARTTYQLVCASARARDPIGSS